MLYYNFSRLLKMKGIHRPFSYLISLGYSRGMATRLANNDCHRINLSMMLRICRDLNCTPNDIFDFRPTANSALPKDHALHSLTKEAISNEVLEKINTLPVEKIQQIHDIIKNME